LALVALSVVEQRYRAVMAVLDGARVSEVAVEMGVSRQVVHAWLARYRLRGWRVWRTVRIGRAAVRIRPRPSSTGATGAAPLVGSKLGSTSTAQSSRRPRTPHRRDDGRGRRAGAVPAEIDRCRPGSRRRLVGDHLSAQLLYTAADWSLERAAEQMIAAGCRHVVVLDGSEIVGILSMRDIVRCWTTSGAIAGLAPR
jgi:excisionase family DNA binding protein